MVDSGLLMCWGSCGWSFFEPLVAKEQMLGIFNLMQEAAKNFQKQKGEDEDRGVPGKPSPDGFATMS